MMEEEEGGEGANPYRVYLQCYTTRNSKAEDAGGMNKYSGEEVVLHVAGNASGDVAVAYEPPAGGTLDQNKNWKKLLCIEQRIVHIEAVTTSTSTTILVVVGERGRLALIDATGNFDIREQSLQCSSDISCAACFGFFNNGTVLNCLVFSVLPAGECYLCELDGRKEVKPLSVFPKGSERLTRIVRISFCEEESKVSFSRADGGVTSVCCEALLKEAAVRGEVKGISGIEKKLLQNVSDKDLNELALELASWENAQREVGNILDACIEEASKTMQFLLKHMHHKNLQGRIELVEENLAEVSLRDKSQEDLKVVSWKWPLNLPESEYRLRRHFGITTQKTKVAAVDGTGRSFVCQQMADKFLIYVNLVLIPGPLLDQMKNEPLLSVLLQGPKNLLLLDVVHLDSLEQKSSRQAPVPPQYDNPSRDSETDKTKPIQYLHKEVNTVVEALGIIRERKIALESENDVDFGEAGVADGHFIPALYKLQNKLGELWFAARRLIH